MKTPVPDTRNTLIARLVDRCDAEAWDQFVAIYEPLVYRLALAKGFQDADAREISQEVLMAVSRAVDRWEPDVARGRFRDWLFRIARNLMINFMTRRQHQGLAHGGTDFNELLNQQVDPDSEASKEFNLEYRREVFRWAAGRVKTQVKDATWQAFWMTSVQQVPIRRAAESLGVSVGAIHIARSRVRSRLREQVLLWDEDCGDQDDD